MSKDSLDEAGAGLTLLIVVTSQWAHERDHYRVALTTIELLLTCVLPLRSGGYEGHSGMINPSLAGHLSVMIYGVTP
jgi:hypothetical protein